MRAHSIRAQMVLAAGGLGAAFLLDAGAAAAAEKCFDKGALSYVECPKPAPAPPPPAAAPSAPPVKIGAGVGFSCYVGLHGGGARSKVETEAREESAPLVIEEEENAASSVAGGGQAGCRYGFAHSFVLGVELDGSALSGDGSGAGVANTFLPAPYRTEASVDWLASVRLRLGYAVDRWTPYLTAGVAFAGWRASGTVDTPGGVGSFSFDETAVGGVVGAGLDYRLTERLSVGAEGLFYFFNDDETAPLTVPGVPIPGTASAGIDDIFVGRLRLNLDF